MPVPSTVNDLDPVASNNSPAGSEPIGPDLDAYLRAHAAIIRQVSDASKTDVQTHAATSKATPVDADELPIADSAASFGLKKLTFANLKTWVKSAVQGGLAMAGLLKFAAGASIASAATVDLTSATGNTVHITGTTGISAWTMTAGQFMNVIFDGILTLTHHATNNALPGAANITTAAGDRATIYYDGTTTYVFGYHRADGTALVSSGGNQQISLVSYVSLSGTAVDFTSIPSWAKKITLVVRGLSTTGASMYIVQLGSGALKTTGYLGSGANMFQGTYPNTANQTAGCPLAGNIGAGTTIRSILTITHMGSNVWVMAGSGAGSDNSVVNAFASDVSLPGVLDRLRITTVGGTETFDAGTASMLIEG